MVNFIQAAFDVPDDIPIEQWEYNFRRLLRYGGMIDFRAPVPQKETWQPHP